MQFLDPANVAGQVLLRLTARGSAIIAELLRLSAHIPPVFKLEDKATQQKYGQILLDFSYVSKAEVYEARIEKNPVRSDSLHRLLQNFTIYIHKPSLEHSFSELPCTFGDLLF